MSEYDRGYRWGVGAGVSVVLWVGGYEPFLHAIAYAAGLVLIVLLLDWLTAKVRP